MMSSQTPERVTRYYVADSGLIAARDRPHFHPTEAVASVVLAIDYDAVCQERDRLQERLEIKRAGIPPDSIPDGITCRDTMIRVLKEDRDHLHQERDALRLTASKARVAVLERIEAAARAFDSWLETVYDDAMESVTMVQVLAHWEPVEQALTPGVKDK